MDGWLGLGAGSKDQEWREGGREGWRDAGGARTQVLLLREGFSMVSAGNSGVFCDLGEQRPGFLVPQSW